MLTFAVYSPTRLLALFCLLMATAGCAIHRSSHNAYRLVRTDAGQILIPPGVATPDVHQRTFNANIVAGKGKCTVAAGAIRVRTSKKGAWVTVTREMLVNQPAGWLNEWAAGLESQGCIAAGNGPKLAQQVAEALPLESNQAFHLLYSNELEIEPQMRLQVVSPILSEPGTAGEPKEEAAVAARDGDGATLTLEAAPNLAGYEITFYEVQARAGGMGVSIVPLFAERHIGDKTERRTEPAINYFRFPADAAFYRVFYEAELTEYAAVVVAARTRYGLEHRTRTFTAGKATCEKSDELCIAVPKQVAINGLVPIAVNGTQTFVNWGTTIGGALRAAGTPQGSGIISRLAVSKLYNGKSVVVEFDHSNPAIFNLIVTGGESISWK